MLHACRFRSELALAGVDIQAISFAKTKNSASICERACVIRNPDGEMTSSSELQKLSIPWHRSAVSGNFWGGCTFLQDRRHFPDRNVELANLASRRPIGAMRACRFA
jgi:hypothetical protein